MSQENGIVKMKKKKKDGALVILQKMTAVKTMKCVKQMIYQCLVKYIRYK